MVTRHVRVSSCEFGINKRWPNLSIGPFCQKFTKLSHYNLGLTMQLHSSADRDFEHAASKVMRRF